MALSMRKQANRLQKSRVRAEHQRRMKQNAVVMLQDKNTKHKIRDIVTATHLSKSTVYNLKHLIESKAYDRLNQQLTDNSYSRKGAQTVLTHEEESLIVHRLKEAADRGFAVDNDTLKYVMARVAADRRTGWKNNVPSDDAVRSFRARHRDLTFKTHYPKDNAKLKGETYEHIQTFFDVVGKIGEENRGLLDDPSRIWNMDETAVDATWGKATKAYGSKSSKQGGCKVAQKMQGVDKHITAVLVCSASGKKAPPFYIVAGKKVMQHWMEPLPGIYKKSAADCNEFQRPNWMPADAVVKCTENGSMDSQILEGFMKHVNNFVRRHVPESSSYLLTMDGHSSRKGIRWVMECEKNRCIPVIKPANTSHILQPCDRRINKTFKESLRYLRDQFARSVVPETRTPRFNLACAVYAHQTISPPIIKSSFEDTGLFPFNPNFAKKYKREDPEEVSVKIVRLKTLRTELAMSKKDEQMQKFAAKLVTF